MIPIKLRIQGFLSYREPVEVDFTGFNLACISGHNGAGKSSLLDAITWSLFGKARQTGEALINAASDMAEVALTFHYEHSLYRIQRILPRGKGSVLEFQIGDEQDAAPVWRPLTEKSVRATQERIEHILRLDYETFVNASFFLQGKADQFSTATASERKKILSSILGLETWEIYRERTADRRKIREGELQVIAGRLQEINEELAQETERKSRLQTLEVRFKELETSRKNHESMLKNLRRLADSLGEYRKLAETHAASLERTRASHTALKARLADRESERHSRADLLERAPVVEAAYADWQAARAGLEQFDALAVQFREQEKRRQPFLDEINAEKARLEQELQGLRQQESAHGTQLSALDDLSRQLEESRKVLLELEAQSARRAELAESLPSKQEQFAAIKAENERLKLEMDTLKERIDALSATEGVSCPLCGQPLSESHRQETLEGLQGDGKEKGDQWRTNRGDLEALSAEIQKIQSEISSLSKADAERTRQVALVSQLTEKHSALNAGVEHWQTVGQPRLAELVSLLAGAGFCPEARAGLAALDAELAALGYDLAAHEAARQAELDGRAMEVEYQSLQTAKAALEPLENEIASLKEQFAVLDAELARQEDAYAEAAAALTRAEADAPDLDSAEDELLRLQEQENIANREVIAAQQLVKVLDVRREHKRQQEAAREAVALDISRHKQLEKAFGKDGVPALLIEQAVPQIEEKANELLDRLSSGSMSIRFATQATYKDKKRDDLKETLDIIISDPAGQREYEMFSGGEAFRVNFAIRLALSEILARRTGARLQTLVIDEGFGSQDAQGRQRLIEAINMVKDDFAKILIITHLDELKEAFPNRIEVEKTPFGSSVRVL